MNPWKIVSVVTGLLLSAFLWHYRDMVSRVWAAESSNIKQDMILERLVRAEEDRRKRANKIDTILDRIVPTPASSGEGD